MKFIETIISVFLLSASFVVAVEKQEHNLIPFVGKDLALATYTLVGPTDLYSCSSYSASNTNSATQNYVQCNFTACGGTSFLITNDGYRIGAPLVSLFSYGAQVTDVIHDANYDDDTNIHFTYTVPGGTSDCFDFSLHEGCDSSTSCTTQMSVAGSHYYSEPPSDAPTVVPSITPTEAPSLSVPPSEMPSEIPSEVPSLSLTPSEVPTVGPTSLVIACSPYSTSYTYWASENYDVCTFVACGGTEVIVGQCDCTDTQYVVLLDQNGNYVTEYGYGCGCYYFSFTPPSATCQLYSLHEGCYYAEACSGAIVITGNVMLISNAPVEVPSPAPTVAPFNCPAYTATNTYYAGRGYSECKFTACGGTTVTINSCDACTGNQYYLVYDQSNNGMAYSNFCSQCSSSLFQVPGSAGYCQTYTIREGCYADESCSGMLTVSGATYVPTPTFQPTFTSTLIPTATSDPSLKPTDAPAVTPLTRPPPMVYSVVIPVVIVAAAMFTWMIVYFCRSGASVVSPQKVHASAEEGMEMT